MKLEFLGQYWNPDVKRVRLLGKGEGAVYDLTPHLPYASARADVLERLGHSPSKALLLEASPFPTVQAVMEAERQGTTVPKLLEPAWQAAQKRGKPLKESALATAPDAKKAHLMACILP